LWVYRFLPLSVVVSWHRAKLVGADGSCRQKTVGEVMGETQGGIRFVGGTGRRDLGKNEIKFFACAFVSNAKKGRPAAAVDRVAVDRVILTGIWPSLGLEGDVLDRAIHVDAPAVADLAVAVGCGSAGWPVGRALGEGWSTVIEAAPEERNPAPLQQPKTPCNKRRTRPPPHTRTSTLPP
jgi:hypothetical protein